MATYTQSQPQPSRLSQIIKGLFATARPSAAPKTAAGYGLLCERLEDRLLLDAVLGTDPLIFDPTPANASSGDEVDIGEIKYELTDAQEIKVTYTIDANKQAVYDLSAVETKINGGALGTANDLDGTESSIHILSLASYLPLSVSSLDIDACATIDKRDVSAVGEGLPTVGTVSVSTNGLMTGLSSYFDTILTPGRIPTSTDIAANTVTFASDPGWATGAAVRVVQGFTTAPTNTGLVTPPIATDDTNSATYFVRNLGAFTYSFHTTYNDAIAAINPKDIIAALPTTGEIIIAGENDALAFLGQTPAYTGLGLTAQDTSQTPLADGVAPASTKITLTTTTGPLVTATNLTDDTVDLASAPTWVSGDRVQVSATLGGLTAGTTYFVRMLDSDTVSFHTTWAGATAVLPTVNRVNITLAIALTTTVNSVDGDDETVTFGSDPVWATGTPVRVSATGGGLNVNTTYFARSLGSGVYSFFDTALNATNTDADLNPLNGRKDLTASITASVFANLTSVSFANPHGWTNGTQVRVTATGGGLTAGANYYVNANDADTVSFHGSEANALGNISPVTFTAPITAAVFNAQSVTFTTNHGLAEGAAVFVTADGAGLNDNTTYFVDVIDADTVGFYTSRANALLAGATGRVTITSPTVAASTFNAEELSFDNDHNWATGTVVRVGASVGGLAAGTNYYVKAIDADTIALYDTLANAQAGGTTGLKVYTAPITALVTPMFDGWCIDNDRFIGGGEYIANFFSSYEESSFPDTTDHPKDQFGTDAGLLPVNTSATPSSTDSITNERATFTTTSSLGWADNQAVRVVNTTAGGALVAGTTYYVDVVSASATSTVVSFHTATPVGAGNKVNLLGDVTEAVFRVESIDFAATTNWPTGTKVRVDVSDGGLTAGTNYYARQQNVVGGSSDGNSVSFYTTRENAQAGGLTGLITLTDPMDATTKVYVPEDLVENPENLDVMNWVLNQNFQLQLAVGQAPTATNIATTTQVPASTSEPNVGAVPNTTDFTTTESVNYTSDPAFVTTTLVRVTATGGGLTAGSNYFIRNLGGGSYSFYNSAANATAGTATGRSNLTTPGITAGVFAPSLASTEDTVTFNAGHGFVTGSVVNVTATGGGLTASTTYYLYNVSGETFSFHTAAAATAVNKVDLTAAITAGVHLQSDDTVTMTALPNYGWTTGLRVQVSATGGGLTAGTDYYIRAISTTTLGFFATAADASNNVNRIDLTAAIGPAVVRPYYTMGDVQRTVWELIENNPGNPGHSQERVNEIMALADAAVGLNQASVDFVPDCDGTVAVIIQPFEVEEGSNEQVTIAQITIAQIPNYCAEGYNCQELIVTLGTIGDTVWVDTDGDGIQDESGTGVSGVTVNLLDGSGNPIGTGYTTMTNGTGNYQFTGLLPGTYTVQFVAPSGHVFTTQNAGANDALDSDANPADGKTATYTLALTPAVGDGPATVGSDLTADAGLFVPINISGVKVWDIDRDGATGGISDTGDGRLAGLVVFLDEDGDKILDEGEQWTTTNADGEYSFTDLGPSPSGSYDVVEDLTSLLDSAEWQPTAGTPLFHTVTATSGTDVTDKNFYNHKFTRGEYNTYSQGGWSGKGVPGQYLLANFAAAFPTGLTVPRSASADVLLTTGAQVQAFLKDKNSSNLQTQFVALSLSVGFDAYDETFSTGTANLGDLKLCNLTGNYAAANGLTVSQYLAQVASYLDGSASYTLGLSSGDLTFLLNQMTLGFDAGAVTPWAELHLR